MANCSERIAAAGTGSVDQHADSGGIMSVPGIVIPPGAGSGIVVGTFITATGTPLSQTGTAPFADYVVGNGDGGTGHPGVACVWAGALAGTIAMVGSYAGVVGSWAGAACGFRSSAATARQEANNGPLAAAVTLGVAPIPGNILVLTMGVRSLSTPPPLTEAGWTLMAQGTTIAGGDDWCGVWMRCVAPGDGQTWGGITISKDVFKSVSEWSVPPAPVGSGYGDGAILT